jgi:hypothetical protein
MSQPHDKRRHPRFEKRVRVRSELRESLELETIDLSLGGLRCTAPAYLPPMTKMALSLVLPAAPGSPESAEQVVNGEAVVVRTEPPAPGRLGSGAYSVALFFSRMEEADRQRLHEFLKAQPRKVGRA